MALLRNERFTVADVLLGGMSALHFAALGKHSSLCLAFLNEERFAAVNAANPKVGTALHAALHQTGLEEVCLAFLKTKRFTALNAKGGEYQQTHLTLAAFKGHSSFCVALLKDKRFTAVNAVDSTGMTALHWAAGSNLVDVCLALLEDERFTAVNALDKFNRTALRVAGDPTHTWDDKEGEKAGHAEACLALMKHKSFAASAWLPTDEHISWGRTAAMEFLDDRLSASALAAHLAPLPRDANGADALHLAAKLGLADLCKALAAPPHSMDVDRPDGVGHTARVLAQGCTGKNRQLAKAWADSVGCFLGRYKLGKVVHESATSKVVHAVDMRGVANADDEAAAPKTTARRNVVLKFMVDPAQHRQELQTRKALLGGEERGDGDEFTVGILASSDDLEGFAAEATTLGHYPQGIVMEAGERNLSGIYLHEKPDLHTIRSMFSQLFEAVHYLHSKDLMHGDLKLLNVVRFASDNRLRLVDFDAAANIPGDDEPAEGVNEYAGAKFSSGALPPEMFYRLKDKGERYAFEAYFAKDKDPGSERWDKIKPKVGRKTAKHGMVAKTFNLGGTCKVDLGTREASNALGAVLPYAVEEASPAIDVWALGTMLFLFLAEENLVPVNRNDDITKASDVAAILKWDEESMKQRLDGAIKDAAGRDLLSKLLSPSKDEREAVDLKALLGRHPFFHPDTDNAEIKAQLEEINERTKAIKSDTEQLLVMGAATHAQLQTTQEVLLQGIFESTEAACPTSCIILPHKLPPPRQADDTSAAGKKKRSKAMKYGAKVADLLEKEGEKAWDREDEADEADEEGEAEQEDEAKGRGGEDDEPSGEDAATTTHKKGWFRNAKRWFKATVNVGKKVKKAVTGAVGQNLKEGNFLDAGVEAAKLIGGDSQQAFYLYLIDEVTGKPVVPEEGEGGNSGSSPYPIPITKPGKWVGKLMPFMKAGLKVMAVANGVASIAQCFFPGVPTIPASIRKKAKDAVGALDKESSVAEFDALSATLGGADGEDGNAKEGQRGAALREFERFLTEHDGDHTFCGLRRTVFKSGDKAGTAVWTLEEDEAVINAICAASAEKRAMEESTYEMLERERK